MKSPDGFFVSDREKGSMVWFLGTLMDIRANKEQTKGSFGLIEQVLPPGFSPPLHVHHAEDEAFYLLEGQASFTCGKQTVKAQPGTFVFFPGSKAILLHVCCNSIFRLGWKISSKKPATKQKICKYRRPALQILKK